MRTRGAIGIDIGTESVKAVALESVAGEATARVVGSGAALSRGIRRGAIVDADEMAISIKEAVSALEKNTGIHGGKIYAGLGGPGLSFQKSKGLIAVSRADGEITKEDMARAVAASETNLSRTQNRDILHKFPILYRIDNETITPDPAGLAGVRLEAEVLFITAFSQNLKNAIKAFDKADVDIEEVVAGPLAAAEAVLEKREKEAGVMLIDIGAATTSLLLFEEGLPYSLEVFPFGSAHVTQDIAMGLRITLEEAEKIKINYGAVRLANKKDELVYGNYSKRKLAEIIEARMHDIFELVEKHLKKVDRAGLLPTGAVIVGGGGNLQDIENFAKDKLKLHARVAEPDNLGGQKEKIQDPAWAGSVGTALLALEKETSFSPFLRGRSGSLFKWLRAFLP